MPWVDRVIVEWDEKWSGKPHGGSDILKKLQSRINATLNKVSEFQQKHKNLVINVT